MEQMKLSIEETRKLINDTTTLFYQQKNQEGFQMLDTLITKIMITINYIQSYQSSENNITFQDQIFNQKLADAMDAFQSKDMVLFSDILIYHIDKMLNEFLNSL